MPSRVILAVAVLATLSDVSFAQPPPPLPPPLRMANVYGDHMVLQQAPAQAIVWGFVENCDSRLTATFEEERIVPTTFMGSHGECVWKIMLPPTPASSVHSYKITVSSDKYGEASISDVMFGDVWVCSGQSNMHFTVSEAFGGQEEIANAGKYPLIRLFTAELNYSTEPQSELISVEEPWSVASPESVGGDRDYFSATCWFFGKNIFETLKYPIGLIATDWGGTPVEAWSSPDALSKCEPTKESFKKQDTPSVLWNAMIYPFLNMTIKGAVWYQGEANTKTMDEAYAYSCYFPAMIDDWREKWYTSSSGQTTPLYFGFAQLAPDGTTNVTLDGFPQVRWSQTASVGYVPNEKMKDVFMAVTIDLGDPTSPYGSVHPRDKSDVGLRLSVGARAIAYQDASVNYLGMLPQKAEIRRSSDPNITEVAITYGPPKRPEDKLTLKYPYGFELSCVAPRIPSTDWIEGTATSISGNAVIVRFPRCSMDRETYSIRYCWRTDPCSFKMCPVYTSTENPSPPFEMKLD